MEFGENDTNCDGGGGNDDDEEENGGGDDDDNDDETDNDGNSYQFLIFLPLKPFCVLYCKQIRNRYLRLSKNLILPFLGYV